MMCFNIGSKGKVDLPDNLSDPNLINDYFVGVASNNILLIKKYCNIIVVMWRMT